MQKGIQYAAADRVIVTYELPFAEVLFDFHDKLKSISRGYASMDYELIGYRADDLVKVDILVNGEPLDALVDHRPPGQERTPRGRVAGREAQGVRPAPAVRGRHPGGHRRQDHRPRDRQGPAQGRHRQVLRRRHLAQAQAPREAERGQEAHEAGRHRRDPAEGVPGDPQGRPVKRLEPPVCDFADRFACCRRRLEFTLCLRRT